MPGHVTSRRLRVAAWAGVAALVAGMLGYGAHRLVFGSVGPDDDGPGSQARTPLTSLSGVDLVVVVDGPARPTGDHVEAYRKRFSVVDVTVSDVLYETLADGAPKVEVGDVLRIRTSEPDETPVAESAEPGTIMFLAYADLAENPVWQVPWGFAYVARVDGDGLTFEGPRAHGDVLTDAAAATRSYLIERGDSDLAGATGLDFVLAWAAEVHDWETNRPDTGPDAAGPITVAFYAQGRPDPVLAWHDADPSIRALDPEITPEDVLSTLEWRTVLLDFEPAGVSGEFFVVLRNELGVMAITDGAVGANPESVLTPPGATWEVLITKDLETMTGVVVETLPAPATDAQYVVIRLDRTAIEAALAGSFDAGGGAGVEILGRDEFESRLEQLAETE